MAVAQVLCGFGYWCLINFIYSRKDIKKISWMDSYSYDFKSKWIRRFGNCKWKWENISLVSLNVLIFTKAKAQIKLVKKIKYFLSAIKNLSRCIA